MLLNKFICFVCLVVSIERKRVHQEKEEQIREEKIKQTKSMT